MDMDTIMNLRNVILIGALMTTASCNPDFLSRIVLPFAKLSRWFKSFQESIRARLREKRDSGFWEIDMTKFEP